MRIASGYNVVGRMMAASLYCRLAFKDARHLIPLRLPFRSMTGRPRRPSTRNPLEVVGEQASVYPLGFICRYSSGAGLCGRDRSRDNTR